MALGLPGRLRISDRPRMAAVCLERIAVGTFWREVDRISSPKPGSNFSAAASVASGVTSRGAGPVPPVVMTSEQTSTSQRCSRFCRMSERSSGMMWAMGSNSVLRTRLR